MLHKPDNWTKTGKAPRTYQLRDASGRLVAEVQNDNHRWRWQRFTSLAEHGIAPAAGEAENIEEAKRLAIVGWQA